MDRLGSRPGGGASSRTFWCRRWTEQSRQPIGDGALPWTVGGDLDLDVAATAQALFEEDAVGSPKAVLPLGGRRLEGRREFGLGVRRRESPGRRRRRWPSPSADSRSSRAPARAASASDDGAAAPRNHRHADASRRAAWPRSCRPGGASRHRKARGISCRRPLTRVDEFAGPRRRSPNRARRRRRSACAQCGHDRRSRSR